MAKRFVGKIDTGLSKPVLVECINNNVYVIKYIGNKVSNKILINDLICSRLAKKVGIMVPAPEIVFIPEELIEIDPELNRAGVPSGKHFGSLYYKNSIAFTGENILKYVTNKEQIPKIIGFDFWVGNDDRTDNLGNILISTSKNEKSIIAIDYGNAFNGPNWINDDLEFTDISIIPLDGRVYSSFVNEIKGINCFDKICTEIESLDLYGIEKSTEGIPAEWGLSELQRELICKYLFIRKDEIRDTMHYVIKEKLHL